MADAPLPRSAPARPSDRALSLPEPPTLSKRRALLELVLGYGLILLVLWTPRPWQRPLYILAALVIAVIFCVGYTTPNSMGLRTGNFFRSLWIVAVALLMSAASIALAINFQTLHPVHGPIAFFKRYWGYALWSFVQQLLLQDFFLRRLRLLLPSTGLAALAAATIFSIAHIPSPVLTLVTFFMGLAACRLFLRYRNLYPLAIAHAILGITLAITLPNSIIHNMRVGLGYLTYTEHHPAHRNHSDLSAAIVTR
ncbi:MAG TPA: CPBP family intramembrane glutamic endopeptidase [Acidobacteriaceae bacterium]|nr:CPBP family intramembrane glutamic endopeptidase [Acidobacteriaceae bacterium]